MSPLGTDVHNYRSVKLIKSNYEFAEPLFMSLVGRMEVIADMPLVYAVINVTNRLL